MKQWRAETEKCKIQKRGHFKRRVSIMGDVNWTDKQKEAIKSNGADLLVSAAAGSGKTAVLVERIKRIILKEKIDIDRILVVTFTNAAASEMKEKIVKAIEKELEGGNPEGQFLRRQLDRIGEADISTFHAFAFRMIRRYFQLIDVEPDFRTLEEGEAVIMQADAMDQVFEEMYEREDQDFLDFVSCYGSDRNDSVLKQTLIDLYSAIMAIPEPFEWISENVKALETDMERFSKSPFMTMMRQEVSRLINAAAEAFEKEIEIIENTGLEKMAEKAGDEAEPVFAARDALKTADWEKLSEIISSFATVTMGATKDEKEDWDMIKAYSGEYRTAAKNAVAQLREKYMTMPLSEMAGDISATYEKAVTLEKILKEYDRIYKAIKKEQNVLDFNDAEHYALDILKNEKVRKEYRDKFEYVFVDEYQDCNVVQDTLISKVSREGTVFMVGDVKQSIYKFRLAEPELFKAKYDEYGKDETGIKQKIDLNKNFRSKEKIIRAVNTIFKNNMEGYDDNAALYRGDSYEGEYQPDTELVLVQEKEPEEADQAAQKGSGEASEAVPVRSGALPKEIEELKAVEVEGHAVAEMINKYVGTMFHDSKADCDRELTYRDIVILRRSVKDAADPWQKIFAQHGIPLYSTDSNGYFDTVEVSVFLDLLSLIDNGRRDVPLLSTMRSVMGGFTIDEMIKVRLHMKKGAYHQAFREYCESGEDEKLKAKCIAFSEQIEKYRKLSHVIPLGDFMWAIMDETGFFVYAGGLRAGAQRQANLRALVDKAAAYQNAYGGSIYGFLRYIEAVKDKKVPSPQAALLGEQDDVVRMMTIHKSKGLEFPMVIVSGLGKALDSGKSRNKRGIYLHKDVGIGLTRVEYDQLWFRKNLVQTLIENREKTEEYEENIRVLYVALTRAKDKLVLTGTVKDAEAEEDRYDFFEKIPEPKNFLDMIGPACGEAGIKISRYSRQAIAEAEFEAEDNAAEIGAVSALSQMPDAEGLKEAVAERLSYRYENEKACRVKSKYSVTELSKDAAGHAAPEPVTLDIPSFAAEEGYESAAVRGTLMHSVMEHIDFAEALASIEKGQGEVFVSSLVDHMVEKGMITEEQKELVETEKILGFFDTDLGRRAAEAAVLRKEAPFNVMRKVSGVDVMVQGVIDCFFEEDGQLVLLDYKTNYIDKRHPERSIDKIKDLYRGQLMLYKEALEDITGKTVKEVYLHLFSAGESVMI